jgi:endonuclease-3
MRTPEQVAGIVAALEAEYPDALCSLQYDKDYELLFSVRLAAQCTDERVNRITPALFARFPTLEAFAAADVEEVEKYVHSCGFYRAKARDIVACAQALLAGHGGKVPDTIEELTALPGVGRKTANVVRGNVYGVPSIVVDTHVGRIARRLGLSANDDPVKVEFDLMEKIPEDHWILINLHLIALGRSICKSQRPDCEACFLKEECPSRGKASGSGKGAGKAGKASAKAGKEAGNASAKASARKKSPAE